MISDFKKLVELGVASKNVRAFSEGLPKILEEYGVSEKTAYNRFKSVYGSSPREVIQSQFYPTREDLVEYVLNSSTSKEVKELTRLPDKFFVGIYDKYFGVSTFQKAKLLLLNRSTRVRNPVREDNRSIIYSQILGDGSYDAKRHALRVIHGEKQLGYLRWKADLLNTAYPKTSTNISVRKHKQGHTYGDYYTPLGNVDVPSEVDCVSKLTNLGWLLWFLDDGNYSQNISICCKRSELVRGEAVRELQTYGIKARDDSTSVVMCGQQNDLLFYKNFIEPFTNQIPLCMQYKVEDIVGGVVI